jgi:hypothetical protein
MSHSRNLVTALAAMLLAVPALHAVDVTSVGDTKLGVYGFVHAVGTYFVDATQGSAYQGSLFYNAPDANGGAAGQTMLDTHNLPTGNFQMSVKPSRFGITSTTPSNSLGDISTKIEMDFNNPSGGPGLRLANIKFGGWTIGKAWSLWVDGDAGADTVDWAGPIGTPCFDTPRFVSIQYAAKLDKNNTLAFSLEQNGGFNDGTSHVTNVPVAPETGIGNGTIPTIVAAYTYSDSWGHIALRGLGQNYGVYIPATGTTGKSSYNKMEAGFMVSGDVKFGKDDLVFDFMSGNALGQYGTGWQAATLNDATQTVTAYKNIGWMAGYTHNWTDAVRSNIILSGVSFSSDSAIPTTADTAAGTDVKTGYSGNLNTFIKLAKNCELGMEYVYEQAKGFGPNTARDQNNNPTSKNGASKVEVSLHVGF